ncbi:MAG TPA: hypothetical protein VK673_05380 [Chthoniobacterales bacterium]|nr:hypothetical protein [Chthoniobacterales bacterium]
MHWLKKATNPLDPHLRAGGYEVLPVAEIIGKLRTNACVPRYLIRNNELNDSLAAWTINAFFLLGGLKETDQIGYIVSTFLKPDHFTERLTRTEAQKIIDRVIKNAERVNREPRDFYFDWIGIFGSVLAGSETPADVDIVFSARWTLDGTPLPKSSYYPFRGHHEPVDLAGRALGTGSRRSALSCHSSHEITTLGMPYQVIWTNREGPVNRKTIFPKAKITQNDKSKSELANANAFADDFRARCADLPPLPEPVRPFIPADPKPLSRSQWTKILNSDHPVIGLAHVLCLPPGKLKESASKLLEDHFTKNPKEKPKAEKILYPYLAASATYAKNWIWDSTVGLRKPKRNEL